MKLKSFIVLITGLMLGSASSLSFAAGPESKVFQQAKSLYEKGHYSQARNLFEEMPSDPLSMGYAVLCSLKLQSPGYKTAIEAYLNKYPYSGLVHQINWQYALNLFDEQKYFDAMVLLECIPQSILSKKDLPEYNFKRAYCYFEERLYNEALQWFDKVIKGKASDYKAAAKYASGYINYERKRFTDALVFFEDAVKDPRFEQIASYYIVECRFMLKDYDFVAESGPAVFEIIPQDRKPHMARLISESFLVKGDVSSAKRYYDEISSDKVKSRGDLFYSGSLLYAMKDYHGAVDNFSAMPSRTDSIGQIANYQLGFSYIQIKNKVAAYLSFKEAAKYPYRPDLQEDAFFNYAKLAFDLNNDPSVFDAYIARYSDKVRGAQIYSYQAVAALYKHDFAAAVRAYDKIDDLDPDMINNYMKANYLRANQLVSEGSYRSAVPCLKAAAYYSAKNSALNQLSRYWLAESSYQDDDFQQARTLYTELYNNSALDRRQEGKLLPFNIAYCYFKEAQYDQAARWFEKYLQSGDRTQRKDALVRLADGFFINKDYPAAARAYKQVIDEYPAFDDLYSYYQCAVSYGLSNDEKKKLEVLENLTNAPARAPFWSEAIYELGRAYTSAKEDDKAVNCYKSLLSLSTDKAYKAKALMGLGLAARNSSDYETAIAYYKKVVKDMPRTEYAEASLLALESIYQVRQEPEAYLAYLDGLGRSADKSVEDREKMVFSAAEQVFLSGNYSKALVSLQAYQQAYPQSENASNSDFYIAECLKNLDKKEQACDYYKKVMTGSEGSFAENAALNYSALSYSLQRYSDAYSGYTTLSRIALLDANKTAAALGLMRSAFYAKMYSEAVSSAAVVRDGGVYTKDQIRESEYITAKSMLATSQRDKAYEIFRKLAAAPTSAEGAEAAYLVIQDAYDQGKFEQVEKKVFEFSDAASGQTYWLAKAFIVLGDSYAERDNLRQAKATFESIRDGYTPAGQEDDVLDNVNMRLEKLAGIE